MDSTGLQLVATADQPAPTLGRRLAIVRGPKPVDRVVKITGLEQRLEIGDRVEDLEPV